MVAKGWPLFGGYIVRRGLLLVSILLLSLSGGEVRAEAVTLQAAMAQAYQTNPSLLAERAKLRATDEKIAVANSGFRPSIDGSASIGQTYSSYDDAAMTGSTPKTLGVEVTQPLFKGFRTTGAVDAAEAEVLAGRAMLQSAEQQVMLDVGDAFLAVTEGQAVLALSKANEEVLRQQFAATQDRFNVGEVTQTDVSQAQSRLQRAIAGRIESEGALAKARATYARLVGDMPVELAQPFLQLTDIQGVEAVRHRAESKNPAVVAASYAGEAAQAGVKVAQGALLPEVNLVGSAGRSYDQSDLYPGRQDSAQIKAAVTVPLYRSGADYARTRAAYEGVTEQRLRLEEARNRAREGATNAWESLVTAQAAIRSTKAQVAASEMALKGVREEAKVGTRTTLDTLNAEQELLDARVALLKAERAEAFAILQVKAAMGELTAQALGLPVKLYDSSGHADVVRHKWAGFGTRADE